MDQLLLVLDLDDTLVYPAARPLAHQADYVLSAGWNTYHFYKRPFLEDFLLDCANHFAIAFWSSGSRFFVQQTLKHILPAGLVPVLAWDKSHCTYYKDKSSGQSFYCKPLHKLQALGYAATRVLVLDNTPQKLWQDSNNLLLVDPFTGDTSDRALPALKEYLLTVKEVEDIRAVDKNRWRKNK